MLNSALSIIHDEHRSLSAVVHGLSYLVRESRTKNTRPNFRVLWAMTSYLEEFPEKLHHPKESTYLFTRLQQRTHVADKVVAELERQHAAGSQHIRDLELALGHFEAGMPDGLEKFSAAVEKFADEILKHMAFEESRHVLEAVARDQAAVIAERTHSLNQANEELARELADRRVREHELRLAAAVFESAAEAIMVTDAENRVLG